MKTLWCQADDFLCRVFHDFIMIHRFADVFSAMFFSESLGHPPSLFWNPEYAVTPWKGPRTPTKPVSNGVCIAFHGSPTKIWIPHPQCETVLNGLVGKIFTGNHRFFHTIWGFHGFSCKFTPKPIHWSSKVMETPAMQGPVVVPWRPSWSHGEHFVVTPCQLSK